jgi:hypothetical protein
MPSIVRLAQPAVLPDGGIQLGVVAPAGKLCDVEYSTNLRHWTTLTNFPSLGPMKRVLDPVAGDLPHRFYRAKAAPQ